MYTKKCAVMNVIGNKAGSSAQVFRVWVREDREMAMRDKK